jgi:hypothetical protein
VRQASVVIRVRRTFLILGIVGELFFLDVTSNWFTAMRLNVIGPAPWRCGARVLRPTTAKALAALRVEQARSEALMRTCCPTIATTEGTRPTVADHVECANDPFADPVNFAARRMWRPRWWAPDRCSPLHTLVERHDLEKSRSGMPTWPQRACPIRATTRRAPSRSTARGDAKAPGGKLRGLERGSASTPGSVTAGDRHEALLYDLWGDAVNTASRMESNGTPGEIQITRSTYELIKDAFVCTPRGTIRIKGKGEMETWYLVGPR